MMIKLSLYAVLIALVFVECDADLPSINSSPASSTSAGRSIPINVINLDKDTDRWKRVLEELNGPRGQVPFIHRLPAVYGKDLRKDELKAKTSTLARWFCTKGMIGCYLSHVNFWHKVSSEDLPYQVVLEDDVTVRSLQQPLGEEIQQRIDELEQVDDNWDVLLLGAFSCVEPNQKYGIYRPQAMLLGDGRSPKRVSQHVQIPHRPLGTHGYVLSKRGARKLLDQAARATWHVDCVIWGIRNLKLYLVDPMIVYQDTSSHSTIGAVVGGLESKLPRWKMDNYTEASLEWAMNEPFLKLPLLGVVVTIGRYLAWFAVGSIVSAALAASIESFPWWVLSTHMVSMALFALGFIRIMKRPMALQVMEEQLETVHEAPAMEVPAITQHQETEAIDSQQKTVVTIATTQVIQ